MIVIKWHLTLKVIVIILSLKSAEYIGEMGVIFVEQLESHTGCGIAVAAMLMSKPYSEASDVVKKIKLCNSNLKITVSQMRQILNHIFNVRIQGRQVSSFVINKNYVCYCRYLGSKSYHWIIYTNGKYYDPLEKGPEKFTKHMITSLFELPDSFL